MTTDQADAWKDLEWGPWPGTAVLPPDPPDAELRDEEGLPPSLTPIGGAGVVQRPVFDPALKQYAKAMRAGEPLFASDDVAARWHTARQRAVDHVLDAVTSSWWAEHLVLRGSVLLKAWFGEAAREPGDLDFVVVPRTWAMEEPRTDAMLGGIAEAAGAISRAAGDVIVDGAGAVHDEIWTYDRVPGRRLVLPWHAEGVPSGTVQLDFVFQEPLPAAPAATSVPRRHGGGEHTVLAATPELSLAWKILWLVTDVYPQGKDLYDAVLLAEATPLPADLLHRALAAGDASWAGQRITPAMLHHLAVDWDEFVKEYPDHACGSAEDLLARLATALAPTFAEAAAVPATDGYAWRARLLEPRIAGCRELAAREGMEAALERMHAEGLSLTEAIVVTREVAGPDRCTPNEAAATYVRHRSRINAYYARDPQMVPGALRTLREQV